VLPLGLLSLQVGFAIFTLLGLALLAWGTWRVSAWPGASNAARILAVVLVLTAWPTVMGAIRGQSTLAVAGLLALSVAGSVAGSRVGSGAALGFASIKPTLQPLWVVWLLLNQRWRTLAIAVAVTACLAVLSIIVVSPPALAAYPAHLLGVAGPDALGVHPDEMINWRGAAERLGGGPILVGLGTVATLALVGLAWWRGRSVQVGAAVAFLATPLVLPHANQHEAILATLGVLLLIAGLQEYRSGLAVAAIATHAVLWSGPALQAQSAEASAWLLFAAICGWLLIAVVVARRPEPRREP